MNGARGIRRLGLVLGGVAILGILPGQAPVAAAPGDQAWTRQFGSAASDGASSVAVASDGSIYVAGNTAPGAFVRKYSANGILAWTRQLGSDQYTGIFTSITIATGVAVDSAGSVYVAGLSNYQPYFYFASFTPTLSSGQAFVSKYSADGTPGWTSEFGSQVAYNGYTYQVAVANAATGVAVGADGGVYVVGYWKGPGGQTNPSDAFVRKYSAAGLEVWTRQFGSTGPDSAWTVAAAPDGVYVSGQAGGAMPELPYGGNFVRKYSADGIEGSTRSMPAAILSMAVDAAGNVYTAGSFPSPYNSAVCSCPGTDAFVRKYDATLNEQWYRSFGYPYYNGVNDSATGVAVDAAGNVYVAGNTEGGLGENSPTGQPSVFVRQYDDSGTEGWTREFGASLGSTFAQGVAAAGGSVYVAGTTAGALPGQISAGQEDAFLSKLDGDSGSSPVPPASVDTDGDGIGNNADPDDDNDGQSDVDETACGSDPLLAASLSADTDGDGIPNCVDTAPAGSFAYVTNYSGTVSVIDTATNTVVATVGVPAGSVDIAVNPAGTRAYVVHQSGSSVSVIDTTTTPPTTIASPFVGGSPHGVAVNPAGTRAYVVSRSANTVAVIDTTTNTVVEFVAVGESPTGIAINSAGTRAYVGNHNLRNVSVIDLTTNPNIELHRVDMAGFPFGVAVNPAGTRVYVTEVGSIPHIVTVIDTATNTVVANVPVLGDAYFIALNPAGTRAYVTHHNTGLVSVIDTATNTVAATVAVGGIAYGVAVNPAGTRAYVTVTNGNDINHLSVIDTVTNAVVATVPGVGVPVAVAFAAFSTTPGGTPTPTNTTTTITSNAPNPSVVGQPVSVTFTVTPSAGTPTGNVTVSDGTVSCTATVAAGTCDVTFTSSGAKTLTATYAGDTNFNGSTSAGVSQDVNTPDTTPPTTTRSVSPAANGAGWHNADVTVTLTASDDAGGSGVESISYTLTGAQTGNITASGGATSTLITAEGTTTVTYRATDNAGNVESDQSVIVSLDKTAPALTVPANMTVGATSASGAVATFTPTATDGTSGVASLTSSPASGSTFPIGTTTVTVTVTDTAGNSWSTTFTVSVVDATAPLVTAPPSVTAQATSAAGAVVSYANATATDAIGVASGPTCVPASGSTFAIGATTVSCTAADAAGNTSSASFTVTVVDTTPPETTINSATDGNGAAMSGGGSTLFSSMTFTFGGTDAVGVAGFQCSLDGSAFAACSSPGTYAGLAVGSHTFRVQAVDAAGNMDASPDSVSWTIVTAAQAAANLITAIGTMGLPAGVANSLSAPLNNFNPNNVNAACGKLNAFINQVNTKEANGQLTPAQAAALRSAAQASMTFMGC